MPIISHDLLKKFATDEPFLFGLQYIMYFFNILLHMQPASVETGSLIGKHSQSAPFRLTSRLNKFGKQTWGNVWTHDLLKQGYDNISLTWGPIPTQNETQSMSLMSSPIYAHGKKRAPRETRKKSVTFWLTQNEVPYYSILYNQLSKNILGLVSIICIMHFSLDR